VVHDTPPENVPALPWPEESAATVPLPSSNFNHATRPVWVSPAGKTPVPDKVTSAGEEGSLLAIDSLTLTALVAAGANRMVTVAELLG